jgi:hypothetical protein
VLKKNTEIEFLRKVKESIRLGGVKNGFVFTRKVNRKSITNPWWEITKKKNHSVLIFFRKEQQRYTGRQGNGSETRPSLRPVSTMQQSKFTCSYPFRLPFIHTTPFPPSVNKTVVKLTMQSLQPILLSNLYLRPSPTSYNIKWYLLLYKSNTTPLSWSILHYTARQRWKISSTTWFR